MPDQHTDAAVEPLELTVDDLPSDVARTLKECQLQDPEFLRRILLFGATHRVVFETLRTAWRV